jgi:hypothetical protein
MKDEGRMKTKRDRVYWHPLSSFILPPSSLLEP